MGRERGRSTWRAAIAIMAVGLLPVAGCGERPAPKPGEVTVIATTTMIGNVVGEIVSCAGGKTTTLMPVGADPHEFAPSSADVARLVKADLVVTNGLGLEEGLADAIANARRDGARVLELAGKLDPIRFAGQVGESGGGGHSAGDDHQPGSLDPHFWHDVSRMARAARLVATELGRITKDSESFDRCGTQVADALTAVDTQVRDILGRVPAERRVLVSDHNAFGYFAAAYGFRIAGVVVPGGSTMGAPSTAQIADLVKTIRAERVPAIFSNTAVSSDLVSTVAREAGTQVRVVPLFVGSLGGRGSGAETYQAMVLTNARRVADALSG